MHCSLPTGKAMHFLYTEPQPLPNPSPKERGQECQFTYKFSPFWGGLGRGQELEDLKVFSALLGKKFFQTGKKQESLHCIQDDKTE